MSSSSTTTMPSSSSLSTTAASNTTTTTNFRPLTSTTAPNKTFATRQELAEHYRSDWHRYNLKRKEAGLPLLSEEDFRARLEAALAVRREREARLARDGTAHLKGGKKSVAKSKRGYQKATEANPLHDDENARDGTASNIPGEKQQEISKEDKDEEEEEEEEEESPPVIDPRQCLFCAASHPSVSSNVRHMRKAHSFFVPDVEYLADLPGLVGYCAEKVQIGRLCLYCQKGFKSERAVRDHMESSSHAKIRYEEGVDLWEFEPFYDFDRANKEFLEGGGLGGGGGGGKMTKAKKEDEDVLMESPPTSPSPPDAAMAEDDESSDGEWEDISDDEEGADYDDYEEQLASQGFDVTPLGELVFPDGRIVGHRALSRYYRQRFAPPSERAAVLAARRAAGERQYAQRLYHHPTEARSGRRDGAAIAAGASDAVASGVGDGRKQVAPSVGRQAKGILVPASASENNRNGFTSLSLYRYRAVVKKARRDDAQGRRLQQKAFTNINRMDKKANRLMNGVSVAHAPR